MKWDSFFVLGVIVFVSVLMMVRVARADTSSSSRFRLQDSFSVVSDGSESSPSYRVRDRGGEAAPQTFISRTLQGVRSIVSNVRQFSSLDTYTRDSSTPEPIPPASPVSSLVMETPSKGPEKIPAPSVVPALERQGELQRVEPATPPVEPTPQTPIPPVQPQPQEPAPTIMVVPRRVVEPVAEPFVRPLLLSIERRKEPTPQLTPEGAQPPEPIQPPTTPIQSPPIPLAPPSESPPPVIETVREVVEDVVTTARETTQRTVETVRSIVSEATTNLQTGAVVVKENAVATFRSASQALIQTAHRIKDAATKALEWSVGRFKKFFKTSSNDLRVIGMILDQVLQPATINARVYQY